MDVPGTTSGGIDNLLLSLPTEMPKRGPFLGQNMEDIYLDTLRN